MPSQNSLNEYIRICRDIGGNFIQGQVIAAAIQPRRNIRGLGERAGGHNCFNCEMSGHFRKECPQLIMKGRRKPGMCPRCRRGAHWAKDCFSKTDIDGKPLPRTINQQQGNWQRALLQGPKTSAYAAMTTGSQEWYPSRGRVQFLLQSNPFVLQPLSEAHQGMQDWTSVPPPEQS